MDLRASDENHTYEVWDRPKAPQGSFQRPLWQKDGLGDTWEAQTHGILASPAPTQSQIDGLHAAWLDWARNELAANLGTNVPDSRGMLSHSAPPLLFKRSIPYSGRIDHLARTEPFFGPPAG
jgi:hypothetical protein